MKLFDTVFKRRHERHKPIVRKQTVSSSIQERSSSSEGDDTIARKNDVENAVSKNTITSIESGETVSLDSTDGVSVASHSLSQKTNGSRKEVPRDLFQKHAAFLSPIPRRKMTVPESILERKALHEKETSKSVSSQYYYLHEEAPVRVSTPLRAVSSSPYVPMDSTVSAEELSAIKRLAGFDEPVKTDVALPIVIPTSGYMLRWLHDPTRYKRPQESLTLLNMRTDYLLEGGGELDHFPFINSPRSVLVLVRNGICPMDLQEKPVRDTLASPHAAFKEWLRNEELSRLQNEYKALCDVLPSTTVDSFFSLLHESLTYDHRDGPQVVKPMLERDDNGIYRVSFHYDVSTAATVVVEKMDRTRANLRNLVESEISLTRKRTETLREKQERSLAASRKHDAQIAIRKQQLSVAAAIRSEAIRQRAIARRETSESLRQEAEARYNLKQERLALTEARMLEEQLERKAWRRLREEEREAKRLTALKAADDHQESILEQRKNIVERKNEACELAKQAKLSEQREAKERRQENEKKSLARKQENEAKENAAREIRLKKQLEREEAANEQVSRLRQEQSTSAAIKHLVGLQKIVLIDERQRAEEDKLIEMQDSMIERREIAFERQQRLLTILDHRRQERRNRREEIRLQKEFYLQRQTRKDQFASLLAADKMLEASAKIDAASKAREAISKGARFEREMLLQWRQKILLDARKEAEVKERVATLALFNEANPSAAVLFGASNAAAGRSKTIQAKQSHAMPLVPSELT